MTGLRVLSFGTGNQFDLGESQLLQDREGFLETP
jgi:hypothetical protein